MEAVEVFQRGCTAQIQGLQPGIFIAGQRRQRGQIGQLQADQIIFTAIELLQCVKPLQAA